MLRPIQSIENACAGLHGQAETAAEVVVVDGCDAVVGRRDDRELLRDAGRRGHRQDAAYSRETSF